METTDKTATDLQEDTIGPVNIKEYREQVTRRMKDDKHLRILAIFLSSIFQDFESFLRTENDLVEDDIKLVLDEDDAGFITYELEPGIYTFKDLSEALFNNLQPEYL